MSMNGVWERITSANLEQLLPLVQTAPWSVSDYLDYWKEQPERPQRLDVWKNWAGLHFLLSTDTKMPPPPSTNAVFGGEEIGDDTGYGPARYLTQQQVREIAASLQSLSLETITARHDPAAMTAANLYPFGGWEENKADLLQSFTDLQRFYLEAAQAGDGMLLFLR